MEDKEEEANKGAGKKCRGRRRVRSKGRARRKVRARSKGMIRERSRGWRMK